MSVYKSRSLWKILIFSLVLWVSGSLALARFESISWSESAYHTSIILLTHYDHYGFHDSDARAVVIILVISSLVVIAYLLKWFAEYMIGIGDNVKKRKMKLKISRLKNHYVICGLGRVGSQVAREMASEGIPFVGMDRDAERVNEAIQQGYLAFQADSTSEEALLEAGIAHAAGLVASLGEDSHNLFVTLAAKSINPNIYVVARANRAENEVKLERAGADRVALPYQIGGYHMASMALRPNVVDYMDIMSSSGHSELAVEEMVVGEHSKLAGHRLGKALAEGEVGATVIAINGADGLSRVRPTGHEVIYPGDRLIMLGAKKDLTAASDWVR